MKNIWEYNRLKNNRVRNIILGLTMIFGTFLFKNRFIDNTKNDIGANFLLLLIIYLFSVLLFLFIPIRQVIETLNKSEFVTYYQLGWFKLNYKLYSKQDSDVVTINQDDKRYYCLTVRTQNEGDIIIERYPTLDSVQIRASELKELLS